MPDPNLDNPIYDAFWKAQDEATIDAKLAALTLQPPQFFAEPDTTTIGIPHGPGAWQANVIIDEVQGAGSCDFVVDIAARLPLAVVCELMGVPGSEFEFVFDQTSTASWRRLSKR